MTIPRRTCISLAVVLLLSVLMLSVLPVAAAEKYMHCSHADFTVVIDSTGGALITENWKCDMSGDMISRYRRHYSLPDPCRMSVKNILIDGVPLTLIDSPDEDRPEGYAAVFQDGRETNIEIYFRAREETRTFTLSYYVENLVTLYDDCGECHWNLASEHEAFHIDRLTAYIEIPYGTKDRGLYFWGVGPEENASFTARVEDGMVNKFDLYLENIPRGQTGGFRFAMPPELFPDAERYAGGNALDRIRQEQEGLFQDPDGSEGPEYPPERPRLNVRRLLKGAGLFLAIGPLVIGVVLTVFLQQPLSGIYLRRQYKKNRRRPARQPEYYRSLPDDMPPALVHKLAAVYPIREEGRGVKKEGNAFSATILDMVDRGLFKARRLPDGGVSYYVNPEAAEAPLTNYEGQLVGLFIEAGAGEAPLTTAELTGYMRRNYSWCKDKYRSFFTELDNAFEQSGLVEIMPGKSWKRGVFLPLAIVNGILIFLGMKEMLGFFPGLVLGAALGPINILLIRSTYCVWRPAYELLTQAGEDRYALWIAYRRYLEDFTTFQEREVADIRIWRKYLVYAAALGCSKKVIENLKISLPEVYEGFAGDPDFPDVEELERSVYEITEEGGYSIPSSSSDSSSGDSDDWGGVSDSGGDSDTGSSGSDFD